jgi:hypothetical protein
MRAIAFLWVAVVTVGIAAKPEDAPYQPAMSGDFWRAGELYPSALGLRRWKPADPKEYTGRFVGLSDPSSTIELGAPAPSGLTDDRSWRIDGVWKLPAGPKPPRSISWTNARLELGSENTHVEAARGCFFIFFVLYRDPDHPGDPRPALLIEDRLFVRQ